MAKQQIYLHKHTDTANINDRLRSFLTVMKDSWLVAGTLLKITSLSTSNDR